MSSMVDRRLYRGSSAEERRAQRREQFLEAAIRVYGEQGYRHATVKAVCEAAGLTERYFYESFSNSEELLVASFQAVTDFLLEELEKASASASGDAIERTRTMLQAYYEALKDSPQSARVFLVEISGVSPEVDRAFVAALEAFGALLARTISPHEGGGTTDDPLLRAGVVGGVLHIALNWILGGYTRPIREVVNAALRLCLVLAPGGRNPTRGRSV
ncbi:TetR family transcriptional regulator [Cystobacter ferrugineus]|uniref:TetR family transcriptional regulator n=2 Tax=Cystobacter ferrugineus TaxID=83449 RepID=A0A1L9BEI4_9BACT|nr:transcriptional regulator TetR family [Cystobacter ferrugineus]OJH40672.1 TetR family transcriptional regulator [Cystobacter ferrugineus]